MPDEAALATPHRELRRPGPTRLELALRDLKDGLECWRLWGLLGWQDVRTRYRRSLLGPFWLTISAGILIGTLGYLYSHLFRVEVSEYLPFLALGILIWGFIASAINDGCETFIAAEGFIKQVKLPFTIHVYRVLWRGLIIFAHNIVVYVFVALYFGISPGWAGLWALPGLALLVLNGAWVALLLGMISARFRDVPQIVASLISVIFFLTPIIWMPELLPERVLFVEANPFYHAMEIVRAPLLGDAPELLNWVFPLGTLAVGGLVTFLFFVRFRARIPYWL